MGLLSKLFEKVPDLHDDLHFSTNISRIRHSIEFYGECSDETNEQVLIAAEKLKKCYLEEYPLSNEYHIASKNGNYYLKTGALWDSI